MSIASIPKLFAQIKVPVMILSAICLLGAATSSWAATSVGGSFIGRGADPADILAPSESAGFVPQTHWNNIDSGGTFKGTSQSMIDSAGNFTAVKIIYDASDSWNSDGGTATPNEKLMKGIIKVNPEPDLTPAGGTERMTFTITNLTASSPYNIIVYATENGGGAEMDLTLGATTYYIAQEAVFSGTFTLATSTTPGTYVGANYAEFDGVTSTASGTITFSAKKNIVDPQLNDGAGIAGIQVIRLAGGFAANTTPCSITANPANTLSLEGGTATFTVGTAGPCAIQWTKNGSPLAGKTDATLVYGPVLLADNGAQFRAVVYNNVNTNTSTAATLEVDANTPPSLTQGFFKVERWENIGGATGTLGISDLKTNIPGSGVTGTTPTTIYYVGGPNVPQTANPNLANFGAMVWGWVKPDVTGDYDFFIRSDDPSELYLNPTAAVSGTNTLPDVQVDAAIAYEYGCCNPFQEPPSPRATAAPIHLEAGKLYGFVALYKEGGGGDYVQVAWRNITDPTPAASLQTISAANCYTMATPAGQRATITTQPVSTSVVEGRMAIFRFEVATTPVAGSYSIQWLKNGTVIPGATSTSYRTPPTVVGDNGAVFTARALTLRGVLTSNPATLTVIPDTFPPVPLVGAIIRGDGAIQVGVGFDETINTNDIVPGNFSLIGGSSTLRLPTNSYNDYKGVLFDTTGLIVGNTYTVHVANVRDWKGNAISASGINVPFTVGTNVGWADTGTPIRPGQVIPVGVDGFDILNGGRQEWGSYDEATFARVKKTGDFDMQVQVVYAEPGSQWTRVGLMARNALNINEDPGDRSIATGTASAFAQTHVNPNLTVGNSGRWDPLDPVQPANNTPNNGHEQNQRLTMGGATSGWGSPGTAPVYPDVWLRMKRVGTDLQGFRSEDGVNWTAQGSTTLTDQQPDMFVGPFLAVETGNIWPGASFDVWGPFDATYDRLFVAQFRNFGSLLKPSLSIVRSGGNVIVTYGGTLQSAPSITGPWTNVIGATSPYTTSAAGAPRYFRSQD